MQIPYTAIPPETLTRMLEEYVTRDGTDYGEQEVTMLDKVAQLRSKLISGEVVIVFDEELEAVDLVLAEELANRLGMKGGSESE